MARVTLITGLIASLLLVGSAARAQSPKLLYGATTGSYGPAAVTATAATASDNRSQFMVAAFADGIGNLEVKAWHDTTKELTNVGQILAGGQPILAVAAADLDSSEVVTADIDNEGELVISTWTVGTSGIAPLNSYTSPMNTGALFAPALAMTALSPTEVVIAYSDLTGDLIIQAWNIPPGGQPEPITEANGGAVAEAAIAAIDGGTVITATNSPNDATNDLYITTWGVSNAGIVEQNQYVQTNIAGVAAGISIAAGTVTNLNPTGRPPLTVSRYAVAPVANTGKLEALYFEISPSGTITETADKMAGGTNDDILDTAAVMLPSGVPISAYSDQLFPYPTGFPDDLDVGWVGYTEVSSTQEKSGSSHNIWSVSAAPAGDNFSGDPTAQVSAYFVTGVLYAGHGASPSSTGMVNEGTFRVQVWSYPVALPVM